MQPTVQGFTILVCAQESCVRSGAGVIDALGALVRASRHGVLVRTGCNLGAACRGAAFGGMYAVVQPCDRTRRPTSPAVHVGPLLGPDDVTDLAGWIHDGAFDGAALPLRLRAEDRARVAAQN